MSTTQLDRIRNAKLQERRSHSLSCNASNERQYNECRAEQPQQRKEESEGQKEKTCSKRPAPLGVDWSMCKVRGEGAVIKLSAKVPGL